MNMTANGGLDDDRWAGRGEYDCQHEVVEDDRWMGKGEVDCKQRWDYR